jgi:LPXTG-motif cell wall-anchored protein
MNDVTMIRVVAGVLFVVVLFIIIWRRKRKATE